MVMLYRLNGVLVSRPSHQFASCFESFVSQTPRPRYGPSSRWNLLHVGLFEGVIAIYLNRGIA